MNTRRAHSATRTSGTVIACRPGRVRVCSAALAGSQQLWQDLLARLLPLADVVAVSVDHRQGVVDLQCRADAPRGAPLLERLAAALGTPSPPEAAAQVGRFAEHLAGTRRIDLVRRGAAFTPWRIVHELPGRLRLRDAALRGRTDLARRLELDLHTLPGVHTVAASATTGSLLLRFDPAEIDRDQLLAALDEAVASGGLTTALADLPARGSFTLANTTLALATAGELLFPALLPASALLLLGSNVPAFLAAWRDARAGRVGLPLLQTTIVAGTLATGGYVAASLMSWLLLFWQNRHARRVATARQILGAAVRKRRRTAWVCRDGVELETPVERLQAGDLVALRAGDVAPADGRVTSGTAMVDESTPRGDAGLFCRTPGATLLRGSLIVEGELRVEVTHCDDQTLAGRIGQTLDAATRHTSLSLKHAPPPIAQRAVSPALLTAGVGLMVGDATTAAAILRPDYSTGPGIGGALSLVRQLGDCLHAGLVVGSGRVFAAMADVDLVLIDDHPALDRRALELCALDATGWPTEAELLRCAAGALSHLADPRSEALRAECRTRGVAPANLSVRLAGSALETVWEGRSVRIEGLAAEGDDAPLTIHAAGLPVGELRFRRSGGRAAQVALTALRVECRAQVGLLTAQEGAEAERLATELGADFVWTCGTDRDKADRLESCRRAGHRSAYVGNCRDNPQASAAADVAVALDTHPGDPADPADVWLLQSDYGALTTLWEVSRTARRAAQTQQGLMLIPNLTCVAGAFLLGFTSLAAVIISNLGTYTVYRHSVQRLRHSERRLLSRRRTIPVTQRPAALLIPEPVHANDALP